MNFKIFTLFPEVFDSYLQCSVLGNGIKKKIWSYQLINIRDYSKDKHKVKVYYEIGRLLNEAGKDYGKNIIKQYAEKLIVGVGKNIMKELFIGYENSLKYLVMKN